MPKLFVLIAFGFAGITASAQSDTAALAGKRILASALVAQRITQKMKDTLNLSDTAAQQLYRYTLQIQKQKYQALDTYRGTAGLPGQIARLEFSRDSLYAILLDPRQLQLYQSKKNTLVSNN